MPSLAPRSGSPAERSAKTFLRPGVCSRGALRGAGQTGRALDDEFELLEDGSGVDPDSLEWELNEWDTFSLEAAVQLREQAGEGEVVAVTVGDEEAEEGLLALLAKGADRGDPGLGRGRSRAPTRWRWRGCWRRSIRRESPDLVLCGVQSSDAVNGATGVALAGYLGLAARRGRQADRAATAAR